MQNFMRKHRRLILIFILLFIAIPFVFAFGMPSWFGNTPKQQGEDEVIARIGPLPVYAAEFRRNLDAAAQQRGQATESLTYAELDANGTAERILQQMIDGALITYAAESRDFRVDRSLYQEIMKQWEDFQDEEGNFDAAAWNRWVQNSANVDWNELYENMRKGLAQQVYVSMQIAPAAQMLQQEIEEELEENHTKLKIRFAKIEPDVEPTEEEITKHYEENKESYREPDSRIAAFIAVSLEPEMPKKAVEAVEKARAGADFAELAAEYSSLETENGGDMGWQSERENEIDFRKPLFKLAPGAVSDPVPATNSFFIYKVEEERTNEETGKREVKARQIMIKAELSEEELEARKNLARRISEKAKEAGSIAAAAEAFEKEIQRTGAFSEKSNNIENIPRADARTFRMAFSEETPFKAHDVIEGRNNLYIAEEAEHEEGEIPPLEEIRETVRGDTIAAIKQTEDYKAKVAQYTGKIQEEAEALEDIKELFPDLDIEIKETEEFTQKDYLYKDKLYLQTTQIFDAVGREEPGAMGGPLQDFRGASYFVELVSKTPPSEEDRENWEEQREQLEQNRLRMAQNDLIEDMRLYLRQDLLDNIQLRVNQQLINEILGRDAAAVPEAQDTAPETEEGAAEEG
jgi:parvulin-like peptidyl-prolyl isomerase